MRHRVAGKKLGRDMAHRRALLKNLSESLILHGSITTTLAKARYVRPYIEKLVTKAKKDSEFVTIKKVRSRLITDAASKRLFRDVAPKFVNRPGGYTRIIKLGNRLGDNAPMARLEFVEDISSSPKPKKKAKKKKVSEKKVTKKSKEETKKSKVKKDAKTKETNK